MTPRGNIPLSFKVKWKRNGPPLEENADGIVCLDTDRSYLMIKKLDQDYFETTALKKAGLR